jgi:hypothetical protein
MGGFMHLYAQLRSTSAAKYGGALAGSTRLPPARFVFFY